MQTTAAVVSRLAARWRKPLQESAASTRSSTGHDGVLTMPDLEEYVRFNDEFLATVRNAKRAGRTIDEVVASWTMPEKYVGYGAAQPARVRSNVEVIYNELQ